MHDKRHTVRVASYVILIKDNKVLLLLRNNTGWMDNHYGLPSGHLEENENIREAAIREAYEEIGINIKPEDLNFVHVMHRHEKNNFEYIDFFFVVTRWQGLPTNNESEKSLHIKWYDINALPDNVVPNVKAGIQQYSLKSFYSEFLQ